LSRARSLEPLTSFTRSLLSGVSREELVLGNPPPEAVVFKYANKRIVSVAALEKAWNAQ
jgi:hypothetical protein